MANEVCVVLKESDARKLRSEFLCSEFLFPRSPEYFGFGERIVAACDDALRTERALPPDELDDLGNEVALPDPKEPWRSKLLAYADRLRNLAPKMGWTDLEGLD